MARADKVKVINEQGPMGWVLFTAWIGALVYFIHLADGFWDIILAILKSIVWPAFLVYSGLEGLGIH